MHKFLILGGDARQACLNRKLIQNGYPVTVYPDDRNPARSLQDVMEQSGLILCPIPFTKDKETIFSEIPFDGSEISTFLAALKEGHVLFGGNIPLAVREFCVQKRIPYHDFMEMDDVSLKNAVATAEGAIAEAVRLSPVNLHHSRCLVTGYGRCGKILSQKLKGLDARVTVSARNEESLAMAEAYGMDTAPLKDLRQSAGSYDFLFNTIPSPVFDREMIDSMKSNATIIDIASAPGGTDFEACRRAGIRAQLTPGLPGKYSPESSADILYEAVMKYL